MKKRLLVLFFIFSAFLPEDAFSQSLSPSVVAADGNFYSSPNASLSWTLGEVITETWSSAANHLTQGFQQPELLLTGQDESPEGVIVSLFPNPTAGNVMVKFSNSTGTQFLLQLFDLTGKEVKENPVSSEGNVLVFNINDQPPGLYLLKITNQTTNICSTYKIQKIH